MRTPATARTVFLALAAAGAIQLATSAQTATPQTATPPATPPAAGQGANANTPPAPRPTPPPAPSDQAAYAAANALADPAAKLAALRKFQADFPKSPGFALAENGILDVLITNFPDRISEI